MIKARDEDDGNNFSDTSLFAHTMIFLFAGKSHDIVTQQVMKQPLLQWVGSSMPWIVILKLNPRF